jgi:hypothetical protein
MCRECGIIKLVGCLIPFVGSKQNMLKLKKGKKKKNDFKLPLQGNNVIPQKWAVFIANKKHLKRKPKPEKIKTIGTAYPAPPPFFLCFFVSLFFVYYLYCCCFVRVAHIRCFLCIVLFVLVLCLASNVTCVTVMSILDCPLGFH